MGRSFLLKQHLITQPIGESTFTPFQIETAVLLRLHQAGCRVPELYWWSDPTGCLLMEWCGDTTLDDVAQKTPIEDLRQLMQNTVRAFCQLEAGFAKSADTLTPYIYPLDYSVVLRDTLRTLLDQGRTTLDYLGWMRGEPMPSDQAGTLDAIWDRLSHRLREAKPTLGTLDYNARNIVVDGSIPTFIDFGSIGWDWGERRLVQSLNSLGANRTNGIFASLLGQALVEGIRGSSFPTIERTGRKPKVPHRSITITFFFACRLSIVSFNRQHNRKQQKAKPPYRHGATQKHDSEVLWHCSPILI